MNKKIFDNLMKNNGWEFNEKIDSDTIASDEEEGFDVDLDKINNSYHYEHKSAMIISVDEEEIEHITEDTFEDWLEEASKKYIDSRLYVFCKQGSKRELKDDGEYLTVMFDKNYFLPIATQVKLQIDRLTKKDDYVIIERDEHFEIDKMMFVQKIVFFKPKAKK